MHPEIKINIITNFKWMIIFMCSLFTGFSSEASGSFRVKIATKNISINSSPFYMSTLDFPLAEGIFSSLISMTQRFELKPNIVKYWEIENQKGKNSVILELRDDMFFHNGRQAIAEDLEFSIVRGMLKNSDAKIRPALSFIEGASNIESETVYRAGMCSGIKILSKFRVKITLSTPNPSLIFHLTAASTSLVPKEEFSDGLHKWKKHPVGAGPYAFNSVSDDGKTIVLKKFSNYFAAKKDSPEYIELINTDDISSTDLTTPLAGRPDLGDLKWKKVSSSKGMIYSVRHFVLNDSDESAKALRALINSAIDKKLLHSHLHDKDFTEVDQFLPPHYWPQIQANKRETSFDELKKNYIQKHGKIPEIVILMIRMVDERSPSKILARQVLKQLQNRGLPAVGAEVSNPYAAQKDGKHYVLVGFSGFQFADPDALSFYFDNKADIFRAETEGLAKIRELLKKGRTLLSRAERAQVYSEILAKINSEEIAFPLFHAPESVFVKGDYLDASSIFADSYQFQYENFRRP